MCSSSQHRGRQEEPDSALPPIVVAVCLSEHGIYLECIENLAAEHEADDAHAHTSVSVYVCVCVTEICILLTK